jgi:hypothetical protein
MPPPLVRRCNGSTAGLGSMEVIWIVPEKFFHRGSEPVSAHHAEEWLNSSTDFNPKARQLSSSASMLQVIFKTLNTFEHPLNIHWKIFQLT